MKNFKLTNSTRDTIVTRLLEGKFDFQSDTILKRRIALADKVYQRFYTPAIRTKMAELPSGWLVELDQIGLNFGDQWAKLRFDGHPQNLKFSAARLQEANSFVDRRRFLAEDQHNRDFTINEPDSLFQEYWSIKQATENLKDDYTRLRNEVKGIIYGSTTSTALVERWPEVAPFLENLIPITIVGNLPAVRLDAINEKLGLKKAA
jgi:hypothetical protein